MDDIGISSLKLFSSSNKMQDTLIVLLFIDNYITKLLIIFRQTIIKKPSIFKKLNETHHGKK